MPSPDKIRALISADRLADEATVLDRLITDHGPDAPTRARAAARGTDLVRAVRGHDTPGLMEVFLAEYGLSTDEGVALMCLAEALLRVPDAPTMDALIEDKIAPSHWGRHLGQSASSLVNASTWALMLTGKVLSEDEHPGITSVLRGAVKRLGEPVIRVAVGRAMKELGQQFVLGETIDAAIRRGKKSPEVTHSFDMLGEAALTRTDADAYFQAYAAAIARLAKEPVASIADAPGISIKLSALHPRYEVAQHARVLDELVPRLVELARAAADARIGLNIDAEEADRLELSLDVIQTALADAALAGWDGFGIVVQAYGQRAGRVIDWFYALARTLDRKVTLRLVKGAYWDSEIKRAQVAGLSGFPVFTRKVATDAAYLCLAAKLLTMTDRIYPQFATHNAHTMAAIFEMAGKSRDFEFQRLHGMGAVLHDLVRADAGTRHRVYAPVGAHRDLLAYLVRRLLENGANSSFVHQLLDAGVAPEAAAADPFDALPLALARPAPGVVLPAQLFGKARGNAEGWELTDALDLAAIDGHRDKFKDTEWMAEPLLAVASADADRRAVTNPADPALVVGHVQLASRAVAARAVEAARSWDAEVSKRAEILSRAAAFYEAHSGEFFALLAREAGKCLPDAVSELREAVDFLRYYAAQAATLDAPARGTIAAISPWNFPLAIFTGQIAAALAAGNAVIAKPAEATPLVAFRAVQLMHAAGVPRSALQFLPGQGREVGAAMVANPAISGVAFTGSTATAQGINRAMADHLAPDAALIAETGGLNAMIVDSTALPEQAVRDIVTSAFQSAGQRCSALRMLYVQEDVADSFTDMLTGAMDELRLGDPWALSTDVGPVIDDASARSINDYVEAQGDRVLHRLAAPDAGHFVAAALIKVSGIQDLAREVFGPVLHIATYAVDGLDGVVDAINARGFGLTFGMHSRIDDRVAQVTARLKVGNIYINRNQIGAVVESQPFGGEGLSGTGPKAGGPQYLPRLCATARPRIAAPDAGPMADAKAVRLALRDLAARPGPRATQDMPGPTGESNRLSLFGRGAVLCLGPTAAAAREQARVARGTGCAALAVAPGLGAGEGVPGLLSPETLTGLHGFDLVADWSADQRLTQIRRALADRDGPIVLLAAGFDLARLATVERHLSIDTTAAGGNTRLLAAAE